MHIGLGPHERLGGLVVAGNVGIDVSLQRVDLGERGAGQRLALQDREPAFDLIEPGCPRRRIVEGDEGMARQPLLVFLVRVEIVEDHLEPPARIGRNNLVHECQELFTTPALFVPHHDLAGGHLVGCEQVEMLA